MSLDAELMTPVAAPADLPTSTMIHSASPGVVINYHSFTQNVDETTGVAQATVDTADLEHAKSKAQPKQKLSNDPQPTMKNANRGPVNQVARANRRALDLAHMRRAGLGRRACRLYDELKASPRPKLQQKKKLDPAAANQITAPSHKTVSVSPDVIRNLIRRRRYDAGLRNLAHLGLEAVEAIAPAPFPGMAMVAENLLSPKGPAPRRSLPNRPDMAARPGSGRRLSLAQQLAA